MALREWVRRIGKTLIGKNAQSCPWRFTSKSHRSHQLRKQQPWVESLPLAPCLQSNSWSGKFLSWKMPKMVPMNLPPASRLQVAGKRVEGSRGERVLHPGGQVVAHQTIRDPAHPPRSCPASALTTPQQRTLGPSKTGTCTGLAGLQPQLVGQVSEWLGSQAALPGEGSTARP